MKILMFAPGLSIHSQRSLHWLLRNGCEVTYVDRHRPMTLDSGNFHFVPYPRVGTYYLRKFLGSRLADPLTANLAARSLQSIYGFFKPDLVHIYCVDYRAYQCMKAGLTPVVLSVWGSDINDHFSTKVDVAFDKMTGQALNYAKKIIVDSPYMLEQCSRLVGRRVEGEVLTLGVDTRKFRPGLENARNEWRKKLGLNNDAKVLLSIRMCAPQYRHHLILKAFASAKAKVDDNSYLVFKRYSNKYHSRSYEERLLRDADNLGIKNYVRILEEVPFEKMPEIYAFADVIVNYPQTDAFPVSFLEASACEKPVITGRLPSYLGTLAERYYRMVDLDNIDDLTRSMVEFMNTDHTKRNELSIAARNEILQHYDEALCANRLMEIYRQVILENPPV